MKLRKATRPSFGIFLVLGSVVAAALTVGGVSIVVAATTHWTSPGTTATHSALTHSNNPGHAQIAFLAPNTAYVSSGGRFHDACSATVCGGAFSATDWSLDIDADGDWETGLSLD
jgi:hypothetical protein